jgi:tetratricopeptide (TPR) repeat protein
LAICETDADSAHVATCRNNLGVLAISQAKFAKAEEELAVALQIGRRQFSENRAGLFPLLNASARLQTIFGRYPDAEKLTDEAEKGARRSLLLEATVHGTQGSLLVGQGKYVDAADQFSKALAVSKDAAVADHLYLADLRCRLAGVNTLLGRDTDLATEFPIAIGEVSRQVGENHPLLGRIECTWGWSNLRMDKKADAKKHFEDAQKIFAANKTEIPESPETGHCLAGMARLFPKRDWREAVKSLQEADNVEIAVFGPALNPSDPKSVETPALAGYLADEALLYTINGVAGDYEVAAGLFERSIAMREKLLPAQHPELASSYERFAVLLKKMNKADEAAAMEKKAQAARESTIKKN